MKVKYIAKRGNRIRNSGFMGLEPDLDNKFILWYYPKFNQWSKSGFGLSGNSQSWCYCRSLKAAIRKIKNWDVPKGTKFKLVSRWAGYDILITK